MTDTDPSILELLHRYRTCGLDATIDNRRFWIRAGRVGAVRTPPLLGERVHAELQHRGLNTPTIVSSHSGAWTFLATTTTNHDVPLFDPLFAYQAKRTVPGCVITLPGPDDRIRSWLIDPFGHDRLPLGTVTDVTLAAASLAVRRHTPR